MKIDLTNFSTFSTPQKRYKISKTQFFSNETFNFGSVVVGRLKTKPVLRLKRKCYFLCIFGCKSLFSIHLQFYYARVIFLPFFHE